MLASIRRQRSSPKNVDRSSNTRDDRRSIWKCEYQDILTSVRNSWTARIDHPTREVNRMWRIEWHALSARIFALFEAAKLYLDSAQTLGDFHSVCNELIKNGHDILACLEKFHNQYAAILPPAAAQSLAAFLRGPAKLHQQLDGGTGVQGIVIVLASFRAEFEYLLGDQEAVARQLVERAFVHLQRSIVADRRVAESWRRAFRDGETACERLGAVHMLQHGIWGFKTSTTGERTDLVFGTRLQITPQVQRVSEALVLTEWKIVRQQQELEEKAEQAFQQARRYAVGSLAGFELSSRRFLVLVSRDHIDTPDSRVEGAAVYEHVNVAVSPRVPSHKP